jgi:pimeloyl-ACP methyl ester carboxylesterase
VVQIDLKGFGRAPKPDDEQYAPSDLAAPVRRLIEERGWSDVTLVGHSLGGAVSLLVALDLVADSPSRLRRLVVVAGAAYPQRLPPFVRMADWPRVSSLVFGLLGARRVVEAALRMIVHDPTSITPEQVDGYAAPLSSPDALPALLSAARHIVPNDLPELVIRYPTIHVPTLLLWGREDPVVPLWVGQRLARELPAARIEVLEGCGHLPPEEHPLESLARVERFLGDS